MADAEADVKNHGMSLCPYVFIIYLLFIYAKFCYLHFRTKGENYYEDVFIQNDGDVNQFVLDVMRLKVPVNYDTFLFLFLKGLLIL